MKLFYCALMAATATVAAPILAHAEEFYITPAEHAACDGDAVRLCSASYPDVNNMVSCMVSNRAQLTPICRRTFEAGLRMRHIHIPDQSASR